MLHNVYHKWDSTRETIEGHLTSPLAEKVAEQLKSCGGRIPPTSPLPIQKREHWNPLVYTITVTTLQPVLSMSYVVGLPQMLRFPISTLIMTT